ncbi:TadE family protein [Naasia sp. SYSU D00948]|uniref:TadE family protein n=1 Tax=Naasia sp. SYSU D00948 TaxID=2817379 RepID=UPI001B3160A6|nr:TadE family protein [Naasia sp. SYSU D00948]
MPRSRTADPEEGSAGIEFLAGAVLLLVPLVYLVVTLGALQAAAFATEGAARGAALVLSRGVGDPAVGEQAEQVVALALEDFGVRDGAEVEVTCRPAGECGERGAEIMVLVRAAVALPLVPDGLPVTIPVEGTATLPVARFEAGER